MAHRARVQRVVDYIENHLKGDLSIPTLAAVSGYSRWHFQHIFHATAGETVTEYVRARRLTRALFELSTTDKRIIEIAHDYTFESQEAFTRSFKRKFLTTPAAARRHGVNEMLCKSKAKITLAYLQHIYKGITMQPKIVTCAELKVVGLSAKFISALSPNKNNMKVIPPLWDNFLSQRHRIANVASLVNFGVCEAASDGAADEACYYACTEVTSFKDIPEGMVSKIIPAGDYAVFTHKGVVENIEHTLRYIYGAWLPSSKKELRDAPDLELYDHRFKPNSENSEIELYIPIK